MSQRLTAAKILGVERIKFLITLIINFPPVHMVNKSVFFIIFIANIIIIIIIVIIILDTAIFVLMSGI